MDEKELRRIVKSYVKEILRNRFKNPKNTKVQKLVDSQTQVNKIDKNKLLILNIKIPLKEDVVKIAREISGLNYSAIICPPIHLLLYIREILGDSVNLGSQNIHSEREFCTGELTPTALKELGAKYVLIGHPDRRYLGEDDIIVNKKILCAYNSDILPILCVGEKISNSHTNLFRALKLQLMVNLANTKPYQGANLLVVYTGELNGIDTMKKIYLSIQEILCEIYSYNIAKEIKILYYGKIIDKEILNLFDGVLLDISNISNVHIYR
jgi:triosephosphate isomerase